MIVTDFPILIFFILPLFGIAFYSMVPVKFVANIVPSVYFTMVRSSSFASSVSSIIEVDGGTSSHFVVCSIAALAINGRNHAMKAKHIVPAMV